MLRSRFVVLLPLALLAAASAAGCDSDSTTGTRGAGDGGDAGDARAAVPDGGTNGDGGNTSADGGDMDAAVGPDTTAPTIVSTDPADVAVAVATTADITASFSEPMDPATITGLTFTVTQGATPVSGAVSVSGDTATFLPAAPLALSTKYTATIATTAADLAGNPLSSAHSWTFTTDATAPLGPAPVALGAARSYVILAESAITNVPTSKLTGNLGLSPAAASYITGLAMTKAGTRWTSPQVVGSIFAADNDPPTPVNLTAAINSMHTAYTDAAGRPTPGFTDLNAGAIGGLTLAPGLYKWSSAVTVPTDVTIAGGPNDVWIFQISGNLTMSAAMKMVLSGGARPRNIVWQVAGFVDLGTTSHAEGIVLSKTAITLETGSSINGRLMAQTAVNVAGATVTAPP